MKCVVSEILGHIWNSHISGSLYINGIDLLGTTLTIATTFFIWGRENLSRTSSNGKQNIRQLYPQQILATR